MQLHLALPPERISEGLSFTPHLAHAAFCIGSDGALLSRSLPSSLRGGQMLLACFRQIPSLAAAALSREIIDTCISRHFSGIVLDAEDSCYASCRPLLQQLAPMAAQHRRQIYVPESLAQDFPQARVLVCTAISGGSLRQRLQDAVHRYGTQRIALHLQRLRMEFPLPCPFGEGTPLTAEKLHQLQHGRRSYYCSELCAHYFTYADSGQTRFVLFDSAESILRKIQLSGELGIDEGFILWPEAQDLLPRLFAKKKEGEP